MSGNTTRMQQAWSADLCGRMPSMKFIFWDGTAVTINAHAYWAFVALDRILDKYSYRPRAGVTGCSNCRQITGGTTWSLHAYGIAVDINWDTNPYQLFAFWMHYGVKTDMPARMVDEIKMIMTNSGVFVWGWGGDYTNNKDTMHFELHVTPAELASGIRNVNTNGPVGPNVPHNEDPTDPRKKEIEVITGFITNRDEHGEYVAVNPIDGSVEDWWQDDNGDMKHSRLGTVVAIQSLETSYDLVSGTNIIKAVGGFAAPLILFRTEVAPGQYKWGDWIPWHTWQQFANAS